MYYGELGWDRETQEEREAREALARRDRTYDPRPDKQPVGTVFPATELVAYRDIIPGEMVTSTSRRLSVKRAHEDETVEQSIARIRVATIWVPVDEKNMPTTPEWATGWHTEKYESWACSVMTRFYDAGCEAYNPTVVLL